MTLRNWESINRQHFFPASSEVVKTFTKKVQYFKKNNAGLVLTYLGSNSISQDMEKIFFFLSKLCKADQFKLQLHLFIRNVKTVRDFIYNLGINLSLDVNIYEQITPNQIPHILNKTDYGIVSLNANHITNNIPGKFVTYTQFSVPIICFAKKGQALTSLIEEHDCGYIIESNSDLEVLYNFVKEIIYCKKETFKLKKLRAQSLFKKNFSVKSTITEILKL